MYYTKCVPCKCFSFINCKSIFLCCKDIFLRCKCIFLHCKCIFLHCKCIRYTVSIKVVHRPNMLYTFEKSMVRGPQKQFFQVSDVQIHKYKYTKIQIHSCSKMQIGRTCAIFLKKVMVWGPPSQCSQVSDVQIKIHKNKNSQIHKYIWLIKGGNYTRRSITSSLERSF